MTFNPTKSISSRYSTATIPSNLYQTFQISGNTQQIIGNKNSNNVGYVYMPYIMVEKGATINGIDVREWKIEQLRKERKEKLEKLGWT